MAVRIASYEGDGADLGALITRVWRGHFAGRSWFPLWEESYIAWRVLDPRLRDPDLVVCAYEDGRLVGCVIGEQTRMRIGGQVTPSALVSYLSVDPTTSGRGVALRMLRELGTRLALRGVTAAFGVTSDAEGSTSKRFWDGVQRLEPSALAYLISYRCWVAVCRPGPVAGANLTLFDRLAPWASSAVPWGWTGHRGAGRAYRPGDLDACRGLLDRAERPADIAMLWSAQRLAVQLDHPQARTLVHDGAEGVDGFAAGYLIDWIGGRSRAVRVGFIELCKGPTSAVRRALLIALGRWLESEGAQMVVMMDGGAAPRAALLLAGFAPLDPHVRAMALFNTGAGLLRVRRIDWAFT